MGNGSKKAAKVVSGSGAVLALGAGLVTGAAPAGAATFNVTTTADSGAGSLRQAILDANAAAGPDTITFQAGLGQIDVTGGEMAITDALTITDPEGDVTIDADDLSRIFYIDNAGAVTLSGLTLSRGASASAGGAVFATGTDLTITDSTVTGSSADGNGGGVAVEGGSLTVTASGFDNNDASSDGGGLYAGAADTTVTDTTFAYNDASSDGGGFAVGSFDDDTPVTVTLTGVQATQNTAPSDQGGGGVLQGFDNSTIVIADSTFAENEGRFGGGLTLAFLDNSTASVTGSTFTDSYAENGGGLYVGESDEATVTITTSTFTGNSIDEDGGGIALDDAGTVAIEASTLAGNVAEQGGGLLADGTALTITNSTISGNEVDDQGGGIAFYGTDLTVSHSTITGNSAAYGAGLYLGGDGGDAVLDHNIIDGNTIVSGPQPGAAEPTFDEYGSAIFVGAYEGQQPAALDSVTLTNNLVNGTIAGVVVDGGGNLFDLPANLGPLADNGGPTQTHDLLAGSAALDAGDAAFAPPPSTDQRGLPRVSNGRIDIGAVEVQVQTPVVPPVEPAPPAAPVPADPTFTG
jgi:hypothetical protein